MLGLYRSGQQAEAPAAYRMRGRRWISSVSSLAHGCASSRSSSRHHAARPTAPALERVGRRERAAALGQALAIALMAAPVLQGWKVWRGAHGRQRRTLGASERRSDAHGAQPQSGP
jgi:hypothetical protein